MLLTCVVSKSWQDLSAASLKEARKSFEKKDYATAAKAYLDAEIENPGNFKHVYNRAVSQYRNKEYDSAVEGFLKSSQTQDGDLKYRSLFNLGNSLAKNGDYGLGAVFYL